jgi:hypothetical protein
VPQQVGTVTPGAAPPRRRLLLGLAGLATAGPASRVEGASPAIHATDFTGGGTGGLVASATTIRATQLALPPQQAEQAQQTQQTQKTQKTQQTLSLGSKRVTMVQQVFGSAGLTWLNLHENEATSVAAARQLLQHAPGRLLTLVSRGERLLRFEAGGRACAVDPNRIFSDTGLAASLALHGADNSQARGAVRALRQAVLALLAADAAQPMVALHNNGGGGFSVHNYRPGQRWASDAASVHLAPAQPATDFFLVTRRALFDTLVADGFSVVLQAATAFDDGSLSVWAQRQGRAYINVEAGHGRQAAQLVMLQAVQRRFGA